MSALLLLVLTDVLWPLMVEDETFLIGRLIKKLLTRGSQRCHKLSFRIKLSLVLYRLSRRLNGRIYWLRHMMVPCLKYLLDGNKSSRQYTKETLKHLSISEKELLEG